LGVAGIALALGLAYNCEAGVLWYLLNRRFPGVVAVRNTLLRVIPAAILSGLLVNGMMHLSLPVSTILQGLLALGVGGLLVMPFILPELRLLGKM
jgi:peptidoglycan biosynthesis protein MviN/MurJ (putative lipid II flippase)